MGLGARIAARARRLGSLPFDEFVELALYDPEGGFYATGGGAGRRGDFVTSPEVGPLFGAVVANWLDDLWWSLGQPDPFTVVESGAGRGALAIAVLDASPACAPALRYVLVERSPVLRARHAEHLALEVPAWALGPAADVDEEGSRPLPGTGPLVVSLGELPAFRFSGAIVANELLDNLPFRLLERTASGWAEVRVAAGDGDELTELLVDAPPALAERGDRLAPGAPVGGRVPVQRQAAAWVADARALLDGGRLLVADYADATASLASRPWSEWVRTYRGHERGGHPLDRPGEQDVTCEVAVDQLAAAVGAPSTDSSQADFLRAHGIDELVEEGRRVWEERGGVGDLAAVRGRSRVQEAAALLDPAGLGAFRVVEWDSPPDQRAGRVR